MYSLTKSLIVYKMIKIFPKLLNRIKYRMNQDDQSISTTSKWKYTPKKPLKWYITIWGVCSFIATCFVRMNFLVYSFCLKEDCLFIKKKKEKRKKEILKYPKTTKMTEIQIPLVWTEQWLDLGGQWPPLIFLKILLNIWVLILAILF